MPKAIKQPVPIGQKLKWKLIYTALKALLKGNKPRQMFFLYGAYSLIVGTVYLFNTLISLFDLIGTQITKYIITFYLHY